MGARLAFVFLAAVVIVQILMWESHASVVRRDADTDSPSAGQKLEEALASLKDKINELVTKIQSDDLLQNVTISMKTFAEKVQEQGQQLVRKIQETSASN